MPAGSFPPGVRLVGGMGGRATAPEEPQSVSGPCPALMTNSPLLPILWTWD